MLFPLVFTNNLVMSLIKYLAGESKNKVWLRGMLGLLSVAGIISASALTGNEIDFNQLTDLGMLGLESVALFFASHYSYRVIKEA